MAEQDYVIQNIRQELRARILPTVTIWNRLEGRPRTLNFDRALKAEVRDALWMLTRQWQMGEFRGDDAGSPVKTRVHLATTRLQEYRPDSHDAEPFENDVPLETKVERRPVPFEIDGKPVALDLRLLMGRHWLKLLGGMGGYAQAFVDAYPVDEPDPTQRDDALVAAHPDAWAMFAAVAGRRMDGGKLYAHLKENTANHAYDGVAGIVDGDKLALDDLAARFVAWFERLIYQSPVADADAWLPDRLEYQFTCSAPQGSGEKVLTADEYYQGHLDWYNFDVDPKAAPLGAELPPETPDPQGTDTKTFIPTQIAFDGMPNPRWWTFEDNRTNFGDIKPDTTDIAKLLLIEFGLVYANDWFLLPYQLPAGSVAQIRGMAVTNVFNERIWVEAAGCGADDSWQRWSMFTLNVEGLTLDQADTSLLLLPTVPKIQESRPLEEIALVRDEMANMVWGIERVIPLPTGWGKPGAEAGYETRHFFEARLADDLGADPPAPPEPAAAIRYEVMNTVPEEWIPFIPVHLEGDNREIQLQRAAMPRVLEGDPNAFEGAKVKIEPRTTLLREGLDRSPAERYFLHEEEVPRSGALVQQTYKRTRWSGGRVFVWLGVSKHTGRGEGSSGLAFDQIRETRSRT